MFQLPDCGNLLAEGATSVALSECSFKRSGNSRERCGASDRLNLYWSGAAPPYLPSFPTSTTGITLDASSKHIRFAICSEVDP